MKKPLLFLSIAICTIMACPLSLMNVVPCAVAGQGDVIESQETDLPGVAAELIQCKRKKGVLTVKLRIVNSGTDTQRVYWPDVKKTIYLMDAENQKKYCMLKDANGDFIFSGAPWDVPGGGKKISWFKFPAPPLEVSEITFVIPGCAPFEDMPIEDK